MTFGTPISLINKLLPLSLIPLVFFSTRVYAQQINQFGVCTQYQEVYTPGGYDRYGNYYSGGVSVRSFNVPCNGLVGGGGGYYGRSYYGRITNPNCNPIRTVLGSVLGGAVGLSMTSTNNNRNNRGWATALGASIGGLSFAC